MLQAVEFGGDIADIQAKFNTGIVLFDVSPENPLRICNLVSFLFKWEMKHL